MVGPPYLMDDLWVCCGCGREVNPALFGEWCPDCGHIRCYFCTYSYDVDEGYEEGGGGGGGGGGVSGGSPSVPLEKPASPTVEEAPTGMSARGSERHSSPSKLKEREGHYEVDTQVRGLETEEEVARNDPDHVHPSTSKDLQHHTLRDIGSRRGSTSNLRVISATSLTSISDSIFSGGSESSKLSIEGLPGASEKLASLVFDDSVLKPLCFTAINTIPIDRFERILRRMLQIFSVDLQEDADSSRERKAAQVVAHLARNSAHLVCNELDPARERSDSKAVGEVSHDSDASGDEVDNLAEFEAFILGSHAFETLRANLQDLVYPAPSRNLDGESTKASVLQARLRRRSDERQDFAVQYQKHRNKLRNSLDPSYLQWGLKDLSINELSGYPSNSDKESDDKVLKRVAEENDDPYPAAARESIMTSAIPSLVVRIKRRILRPSVPAGMKRVDWTCVSAQKQRRGPLYAE